MKFLKSGDTKKAGCSNCKGLRNVTFQIRDVPFSDNSGIAKNILVGVCDTCDSVVVLPHQSTPLVKRQLEHQRRRTELHIPAHHSPVMA